MKDKPSKEQFEAYVDVQRSGVINMYDVKTVCSLAGHGLTKEHCLYIHQNYEALEKEYDVRM